MMNDTPKRGRPNVFHVEYEKAGVMFRGPSVPWNADAVTVEAVVRLPSHGAVRGDFRLERADGVSIEAEVWQRESHGEARLRFRLPTPISSLPLALHWKHHQLGETEIQIVTETKFRQQVKLELPTLHVKVGGRMVSCQTVVVGQVQALVASAVVSASLPLAVLTDTDLSVELLDPKGRSVERAPLSIGGFQRTGSQEILTAMLAKPPRQSGDWLVNWRIEERIRAKRSLTFVTAAEFHKSLELVDSRLVVESAHSGIELRSWLPNGQPARYGPAFVVTCKLLMPAGEATFRVIAIRADAAPITMTQTVLMTDGPTIVAPGWLDADQAKSVVAFELHCGSRRLATLPMTATPHAKFTAEGGFQKSIDFEWSKNAEDELNARLGQLLTPRRASS